MIQYSHIITARHLLADLGTANAPIVVDVSLPEDSAADPWRLPTARRVPHQNILSVARSLEPDATVVTVCQKGLKLSHGAAAVLRSAGITARALDGGNLSWFGADHPRLSLEQAPDVGTAWVLPARRNRRTFACAWTVRRWFDTAARLIWVAPEHAPDVALRFQAQGVSEDPPLSTIFAALGLIHPTLLAFLDAVDAGVSPGAELLDVLPRLHADDEDCAQACIPLMDAAWAVFQRSADQEAA